MGRRKRKWKENKEQGRWTRKMETGKEAQRGIQGSRYEEEGTSKKETTRKEKVRVLYWNVASLRKEEEEFWDYVRQFEIVGLIET
jgi:hypothetical protein